MADGRSRILEAVANASAPVPSSTSVTSDPILVDAPDGTDIVAQFVERVRGYHAHAHDARTATQPDGLRQLIRRLLDDCGVEHVAVDSDFPEDWRPDGLAFSEDSRSSGALTPSDLERVDAAITTAAVAIAATGTVLLDHSGAQGRRVLSLVPDVHVVLVREDTIYAEVPGAVRALGPRPLLTWISGPSATSDIELERVEGVHGPRRLEVIVYRADR